MDDGIGHRRADGGVRSLPILERLFVTEKDRSVGDGDDIVVERARGDRDVGLADEQRAVGVKAVQTGDRLRRLARLSGGKGATRLAIDEQFEPRRIMARGQAHVIGRAFVTKGRGHGGVKPEMIVGEGDRQLRHRVGPFMAAMRHGQKIGDRQVAAAIARVGRGRHGRRIGGPHRRCRHGARGDMRWRASIVRA